MPAPTSEIAEILAAGWASEFSSLLGSMTGEEARATVSPGTPAGGSLVWWEQTFASRSASVPFAVGMDASTCREIGCELLRAAGIEDSAPEDARRTCFEAVSQSSSGAARTLASRYGTEVELEGGVETATVPQNADCFRVFLTWGGRGFEPVCLAIGAGIEAVQAAPTSVAVSPEAPRVAPAPNPKTLDLLMDVELPVTVSFGRTQMPLKDVLRLASGSIVELNRAASEPVEIVVNNCVVARGEVVVVEGNYGVRIREIAAPRERLGSVS